MLKANLIVGQILKALSVLGLMTVVFLVGCGQDKGTQSLEDLRNLYIKANESSVNSRLDKLTAQGFGAVKRAGQDTMIQIVTLLDDKEYTLARDLTKIYRDSFLVDDQFVFDVGYRMFEESKYEHALEILSPLVLCPDAKIQQETEWALVMIYEGLEKGDKSCEIVTQISTTEGHNYYEQSNRAKDMFCDI